MTPEMPWRQRDKLQSLVADWQRHCMGRDIFRVKAGPGWLGLCLAGEQRINLFFVARPQCMLLFDADTMPAEPLRQALGWTKRPPLARLLTGCSLTAVRLLPEDRVIMLGLLPAPDAPPYWLRHQLFGPRGNLALLDDSGRLLWALYRPLHPVMSRRPEELSQGIATGPQPSEPAAANTPTPDISDIRNIFRTQALVYLAERLAVDLSVILQRALRQAEQVTDRLVRNLARDLSAAERGEEQREKAETLATHLKSIPRGAEHISLISPGTGQMLDIALDPALSAVANMEHYFRLARKADRGRAIISDRLQAARARQTQLFQWESELAGQDLPPEERLKALLAWQQKHADRLALRPTAGGDFPGVPAAAQPEPRLKARPFRRYRIEDGWDIWVGRSNEENDKLTHRRAAPNDYWLHAQGVPGSHVILRTGGKPEQVPKRVLQKAADLAALHSKARHSSLVPVIYTLRKYVRKPRKSPPGTAACIREKSLFATPQIPEGAEVV